MSHRRQDFSKAEDAHRGAEAQVPGLQDTWEGWLPRLECKSREEALSVRIEADQRRPRRAGKKGQKR